MSERDGYRHGVPSWVDNLAQEPRRLIDFYGAIFGWDFEGPGEMPGDPPGEYFVARLRGRDVAGIGSLPAGSEGRGEIRASGAGATGGGTGRGQTGAPGGGETGRGWNTYIEVESVDRAVDDVGAAGGTILAEPFDAPPAARIAVVADPAGASFCIWEPRERRGAQLVNEPGAWSMSALNTPVPDEAAAFYSAVLGWETDTFRLGEAEVTLFRLPGYVGGEPQQPVPRDVVATMMPHAGGGEAGRALWNVDFWVGDADAAAGVAGERGGEVVAPPYDVPGFRQAVLSDPEGSRFSVTHIVTDAPA